MILKDKGMRFLDVIKIPVYAGTGNIAGLLGVSRDITDLRKQIQSEKLFHAVCDAATIGISIINTDRQFTYCNTALQKMLGYSMEELGKMTVPEINHPEDEPQNLLFYESLMAGAIDGYTMTKRLLRKDGTVIWVNLTAGIVREDMEGKRPQTLFGIVEDISEFKRMEEELKHQVRHDQLTGLPNRRLLLERLSFELAQAQRTPKEMALLYVDLDRFKGINDSLGHHTGDRLLEEVAGRLKSCIRESDIAARVGGDEFIIVLTNITLTEDAAQVAEKILLHLCLPFPISSHEFSISASIGISVYPLDGEQAEVLLKHADMAMYYAKEQGRNNYQFYNSFINTSTMELMLLENSLRQTLKRGELVVHYQPQIDAATNKIVCAEALVRWQHPELGLLPPMRFIPLAEKTGFIIQLDEWVLRTVIENNRAWQDAGSPPVCISVNLSSRRFKQPGLVEFVLQILRESVLDPQWLELEVTEITAMEDIEYSIENMKRLAGFGVKFTIEDFGTGYSSLRHLEKLPVEKLKIDKALIRGITHSADDLAVVKAIIAIGHSLRWRIVAEGVETEDQLMLLRANDCNEVQGYYYSEPVPADEFKELMALYM
jgi:diguanylate cyclase (GGDEF)-like protein/PAS domain S-box-containing protein